MFLDAFRTVTFTSMITLILSQWMIVMAVMCLLDLLKEGNELFIYFGINLIKNVYIHLKVSIKNSI